MKRLLLISLLSTGLIHALAGITLHTKFIMDGDDIKRQEKIEDLLLDENNQGTLQLPNNIEIGFSAIPDGDSVHIGLTIKKDYEIVSQPKIAIKFGQTSVLACNACPCTREGIDYTLEITPELK